MADFELKDLGAGKFALAGELSFDTAEKVLQVSEPLFEPHNRIQVDLAGVTQTDSAGLALLLEWVTWANHTVREIRFDDMPEKIMAIARTTEVDALLTKGERWSGFIESPTD
jgi:phospholipid transport system transporter-binding protein